MDDNTIVCRCSDLTVKEVKALIAQGYTTFDELKRMSRIGMGPCQGKTCAQLVLRELSSATGKPIAELKPGTYRPPVKGIKLGAICECASGGEIHD